MTAQLSIQNGRNLIALIAMLDVRADCCYSDEHLSSHKLLFQCYVLLQSYIFFFLGTLKLLR